jgi:hypothetical protein
MAARAAERSGIGRPDPRQFAGDRRHPFGPPVPRLTPVWKSQGVRPDLGFQGFQLSGDIGHRHALLHHDRPLWREVRVGESHGSNASGEESAAALWLLRTAGPPALILPRKSLRPGARKRGPGGRGNAADRPPRAKGAMRRPKVTGGPHPPPSRRPRRRMARRRAGGRRSAPWAAWAARAAGP